MGPRVLVRLLVLVMILSLIAGFGCARSQPEAPDKPAAPAAPKVPEQPPPDEKVTLVVPVTGEARTLNANLRADTGAYSPTGNIFSTLVVLDWGVADGVPAYGDLAESWEMSEDATVYTFKLRKNAKWHDGTPVTSADVKYTYEMAVEGEMPLRTYIADVKSMETPDDHTLVITLNEPSVAFVPMLAQASNWFGKIMPKHIYEGTDWETNPANDNPIGSGPFKFKEWVRGSHIVLERNDDYFMGPSKVDELIFRIIPDATVAYAEFMAGSFPYLPYDYTPPYAEVAKLMDDPEVEVVFTPSIYSRDLYLNIRNAPLNDIRVRQAIAHTINREALAQSAFFGLWEPQYYAGIVGVPEFLNRDAKFPEHDLERAGQLLDEAGYPKGSGGIRFSLSVTNPVFADSVLIAEVTVEQLRAVGIDARWDQYDQATWWQKVREGDFDVSVYFTRYGPDYDAYDEHFGTGGGRNFMGYSDSELDRIAAVARGETNTQRRSDLYFQIQDIIVRDIPYINLVQESKVSLVRPGWSGFSVQESGYNQSMSWFGYYSVIPPGR